MSLHAVMPTFNQSAYLRQAVASVVQQVDRLIVVDDHSTDGTPRLLEELAREHANITLLRHLSNAGPAEAINTGVSCAGGSDWLTWVSSDNVHEPHWARTLMSEAVDGVGVVYSGYWHGMNGRALYREHASDALVSGEACYYGPSFVIRHEVWDDAGEHRGGTSHDYDHWLRVEEACWRMGLSIVGIEEPLVRYRVHDERVTVRRPDLYDAPRWRQEAIARRAVAHA